MRSIIEPKKLSILLVDSDKEACSTVKAGLEPDGFLVVEIPTAFEAMGTAQVVQFDLLIIDPFMPHSSKLIERMTRFNDLQRVLFVSDYSPDTLKHFGLCPEGADILRKPFSRRDINGRVRSSLALGKTWRDLSRRKPVESKGTLERFDAGERSPLDLSESV